MAEPIYRERVSLTDVMVYKTKTLLREDCEVALFGDKLVIDGKTQNALIVPFDETVAMSVLGRNKLNVYHGERLYQLKGDKRFNALKFVNIYYRYKNIKRGETDAKFLGL